MSGEEQKARWDLKYEQGLPSLTRPDPFFTTAYKKFVDSSFPKSRVALDLAGGVGRHALWLASRGWQVTVVDVSEVAIRKLRETTVERNINLDLLIRDASEYELDPAHFDLIVLFYHFDRNLFPRIVSALKPGGLLIAKMSLRWVTGDQPTATANPLQRNELPSLVPD
ncbi:MAG: class I SAM-dependent methyltransferase, partial [Terriglobales bacterium]